MHNSEAMNNRYFVYSFIDRFFIKCYNKLGNNYFSIQIYKTIQDDNKMAKKNKIIIGVLIALVVAGGGYTA